MGHPLEMGLNEEVPAGRHLNQGKNARDIKDVYKYIKIVRQRKVKCQDGGDDSLLHNVQTSCC